MEAGRWIWRFNDIYWEVNSEVWKYQTVCQQPTNSMVNMMPASKKYPTHHHISIVFFKSTVCKSFGLIWRRKNHGLVEIINLLNWSIAGPPNHTVLHGLFGLFTVLMMMKCFHLSSPCLVMKWEHNYSQTLCACQNSLTSSKYILLCWNLTFDCTLRHFWSKMEGPKKKKSVFSFYRGLLSKTWEQEWALGWHVKAARSALLTDSGPVMYTSEVVEVPPEFECPD